MTGNPPMLACRGVSRRFGARLVLDRVDLALTAGAVTALLGPSGSGKSTLLRIFAGLEHLDAGDVTSNGKPWSRPGAAIPPEARDLGVVFQDLALFPHLTAAENVAFGLWGLPKPERRARAVGLLAAAGLAEAADRRPERLSGGEQQRGAIARALARRPSVVLLDEPFSSLDAALRRETRDRAMAQLRAHGAAVLLVTHDVEDALAHADQVALMDQGRIVQIGPPQEVYARPVSFRAAALTGDVNRWAGIVAGGKLETPFGAVAAEGLSDGTQAEALVRPEGVTLDTISAEHGPRITARRPIGPAIELEVAAAGAIWRARCGLACACVVGDHVRVTIDPALATAAAVR